MVVQSFKGMSSHNTAQNDDVTVINVFMMSNDDDITKTTVPVMSLLFVVDTTPK